MTRADYSALGGAVTLIRRHRAAGQLQPTGSGSGGNPDLKPIRVQQLRCRSRVVLREALAVVGHACSTWICGTTSASARSPRGTMLTFSSQVPQRAAVLPYLLTCRQCQGPGRGRRVRLPAGAAATTLVSSPTTPMPMASRLRSSRQRRRSSGRALEEHLQPAGLLREQALQRPGVMDLPVRVLQRPGPQQRVLRRIRSASSGSVLEYTINDNLGSPWTARTSTTPSSSTMRSIRLSPARSTERPAVLPDRATPSSKGGTTPRPLGSIEPGRGRV